MNQVTDDKQRNWAESIARSNIVRLTGFKNESGWSKSKGWGYTLDINSLKFNNPVHRDAIETAMKDILKNSRAGYTMSLAPKDPKDKNSGIIVTIDDATHADVHKAALQLISNNVSY